jgi:hypothetical protein
MKKTYQITESGKADLEKELAELKGRRGEIAEKIAAARDFGDLSENAEYDAAREEQGLVETRILEIEDILQNAEIIKSSGSSSVGLGSTVELQCPERTVINYCRNNLLVVLIVDFIINLFVAIFNVKASAIKSAIGDNTTAQIPLVISLPYAHQYHQIRSRQISLLKQLNRLSFTDN